MLNEAAFQKLQEAHPALGSVPAKVQALIQDELQPGDELHYAHQVQFQGVDGVVCISDKNVYCFWLMKMFFFMKFPTIQTFHLSQINQLKTQGASVYIRAEADPNQPDEDYEENQLTFASESEAGEFVALLRERAAALAVASQS